MISRAVRAEAGPDTFRFDVRKQRATLNPPAPFSGTARFVGKTGSSGRMQGPLAVDFPGRAGVSLKGARGGLIRWVANPAHPFRKARPLTSSHGLFPSSTE